MDSWFTDPFSEEIWSSKYQGTAPDVRSFYRRLAKLVAMGDERQEAAFFNLMWEKRFSPGGRILAFGGRPDAALSLMNCTTHSITGDSLEAINRASYILMRASSRGQGIGLDISNLRPMGAPVNNAARTSTGSISFMEMLNHIGGTIGQEGRRAALLFSISDTHPDMYRAGEKDVVCPKCGGSGCDACFGGYLPYDFLHVKKIPGKVESANISVKVSDAFMRAVIEDQPWYLYFDGKSGDQHFSVVSRRYQARDVFTTLAKSAWASAEPGILYWDTSKRMSNSDLVGYPVVGVNACSEEVLDQEGVCNLGSMNLAAYVRNPFTPDAYFDFKQFKSDVYTAVQFLDNVVTVEITNGYYISDQQLASLEDLRRIGLGVMGLADMLAMMLLPYGGSPDTVAFLHDVFSALRDAAYWASTQIAWNQGAAGAWKKSQDYHSTIIQRGFLSTLPHTIKSAVLKYGLRNITVLTIAPTGTISNLVGVSSGIEPLFAHSYTRRHRMSGDDKFIEYTHPGVQVSRMMGQPDAIWPTAYEVSVNEHIQVEAVAQQYIDASISKTVNFPAAATVDDVAEAYLEAWKAGLKGLSVYRDGSRHEQILYVKEEEHQEASCPSCGGQVVHESGCVTCPTCGWAACAL